MIDVLWDLIQAHRKAIVGGIAAALALVLDAETAKEIASVVGVFLIALVPNDKDAVDRVYGRRR